MLKLFKQLLIKVKFVVLCAVIIAPLIPPQVLPGQQLQSVAPQLKSPSKVLTQNEQGALFSVQDYSFVEVAADGSTVPYKADFPAIENEVRVYHYGASVILLYTDQSGKVARVFVGGT